MQFAYTLGIQANEPNNPHNRDMFWKTLFEKNLAEGILFSTITFLFEPGSLNCEADEIGVSWLMSPIDLHLLSSKPNAFCTHFLDILQVLPENKRVFIDFGINITVVTKKYHK